MKHLVQRLAALGALAMASSMLTFLLLDAAPGDFLSDARLHPRISGETLAALRDRYALDQPVVQRYAAWLSGVARGDWGRSFAQDLPVLPLLSARAARTLALALTAQAIAWGLALGLGLLVAGRPDGWLDRLLQGSARSLLSLPEFVVALGAVLLFSRAGAAQAPALPAMLALAAAVAPALWQQARAALLRAAAEPFVAAARSHGLPERIVLTRYVLPAAAPALLSLAGLSLGGLLSSSLLVECVTAYPGLGPLLLDAVFARDSFVVAGAVFLSTLLWASGSFLADVAQWWADPRLREAN